MNSTICLTTTLLVTCVVVGGWRKSLVFTIKIREPQNVVSVSGTVSVTLCVIESVTHLSIRFNHTVGSPYAGGIRIHKLYIQN